MLGEIVPQVEQEVKCITEGCDEDVFRGGLCFDHFVEEKTAAWDDQDAEQFSDHVLDGAWYGDPAGEVCQ